MNRLAVEGGGGDDCCCAHTAAVPPPRLPLADMCCDQDGKCKKPLTLVLPWVPKPAAAAGGAKGGNSKAGDKDS